MRTQLQRLTTSSSQRTAVESRQLFQQRPFEDETEQLVDTSQESHAIPSQTQPNPIENSDNAVAHEKFEETHSILSDEQDLDADQDDDETEQVPQERLSLQAESRATVADQDEDSAHEEFQLGAPNDEYEQEADLVAAKVAQSSSGLTSEEVPLAEFSQALEQERAPKAEISKTESNAIKRLRVSKIRGKAAEGGGTVSPSISAKIQHSKGQGTAVPKEIQQKMKASTGYRFDNIKVKADGESAELCEALGARAFANGADIWLGRGESIHDVGLMAHELTHVVQQGAAEKVSPHEVSNFEKGSAVFEHLKALSEGNESQLANYQQDIREFQKQHPVNTIERLQRKILEPSEPEVQINRSDRSQRLRACGGGASTPTFPTYSEIAGDATVRSKTDAAWSSTKSTATATGRREECFWIRKNMKTGKFEFTSTVTGPVVGPGTGAYVTPEPKPADTNPGTPDAVYTVAMFHTHTPTTYRPVGRGVGPSGADVTFHNNHGIPGLVYDYVAASGGNIPAGHPLNSPAQLYQCGPNRRTE